VPVIIRINTNEDIVYTTVDGIWTVDDLLEAFEKLFEHPDFHPDINGIADLRTAKTFPSGAEVMRIAHYLVQHREQIGKSRTAVLVGGDLSFGTNRVFQAYSDDSTLVTRIFRKEKEARRWLGLDG
jgi:hypothetical protein